MSGNNSWKNWIVVIVLLVVFAVITALWSSSSPELNLFSGGGGRVEVPNVPTKVEPIEFEIAALGIGPLTMSPFVALGALAGITLAGIAVVGAALAFLNLLASRQITAVVDSDTFKQKQTEMEKNIKEELKQINQGRPTTKPDHNRPGWSAVSTSLIIIFFVWLVALVINGTFFPEGQAISSSGEPITTSSWFTIPLLLVAIVLLSIRMRPQRFANSDASDTAPIPWDTIVVITLGLLVVGLGLGAMMFLL